MNWTIKYLNDSGKVRTLKGVNDNTINAVLKRLKEALNETEFVNIQSIEAELVNPEATAVNKSLIKLIKDMKKK